MAVMALPNGECLSEQTERDIIIGNIVYCGICANLVIKGEPEPEGDEPWLNLNGINLPDFCELFEIHFVNDEEAEKQTRLSFCVTCEEQINQLFELYRQLQEIEKKLKDGKYILKEKVECSEGFFREEGIYQKNQRYMQVRNSILNQDSSLVNTKTPKRLTKLLTLKEYSVKGQRRVQNLNRKVSNSAVTNLYNACVLISAEDLAAAEGHISTLSTGNKSSKSASSTHPSSDLRLSYGDSPPDISPYHSDNDNKSLLSKPLVQDTVIGNVIKTNPNSIHDPTRAHTRLKFNNISKTCTFLNVTFNKIYRDQYKCLHCKESLSRDNIRLHVHRKHPNRTICNHCGRQFTSLASLRCHIKHVHKKVLCHIPKKKCPICSKNITPPGFLTHKCSHFIEQDKQESISRGEKIDSTRKMTRNRECDLCHKKFCNGYSLKLHKAAVHVSPSERKTEICYICGKAVIKLNLHLKIHGSSKYTCPVCSRGFTSFEKLQDHETSHVYTEPPPPQSLEENRNLECKRGANFLKRMKGESYLGFATGLHPTSHRKRTPQTEAREGRKVGVPCDSSFCKRSSLRHCDKFTEQNRHLIFEQVWKQLDWAGKREYVRSLTDTSTPKHRRARTGSILRGDTFQYFLPLNGSRMQVCRKMFLSTMGLNRNQVNGWLKN